VKQCSGTNKTACCGTASATPIYDYPPVYNSPPPADEEIVYEEAIVEDN